MAESGSSDAFPVERKAGTGSSSHFVVVAKDEENKTTQQDDGNIASVDGEDHVGKPDASDTLEEEKENSQHNKREIKQSRRMKTVYNPNLKPSWLYEKATKHCCCSWALIRFPRTCAFFLGVIVPLFVLIFLSIGIGAELAESEAPTEINDNDIVLENSYWALQKSQAIENSTEFLPSLCLTLFLYESNLTTVNEELADILHQFTESISDDEAYPADQLIANLRLIQEYAVTSSIFEPELVAVNATAQYLFMNDCGTSAKRVINDVFDSGEENLDAASPGLSFNWIRCYEDAPNQKRHQRDFRGGTNVTQEERSYDGQSVFYEQKWEEDRKRIFDEEYTRLLENGMNSSDALQNASATAASEATGGNYCILNTPASSFFWFTVQTAVGYGNMAPVTSRGRRLVFSLGFLSILLFAGILAMTGHILAFLFDDWVSRRGMFVLSRPWVACIIWGTAYYTWMAVAAIQYKHWKQKRLGIDVSFNEGYWWAYISSTTVGLGDFYLDSEGLIGSDVFIFPLIFLTGFTFLSAFLSKFWDACGSAIQQERKGFVNTLLSKRVSWNDACQKKTQSTHKEDSLPTENLTS